MKRVRKSSWEVEQWIVAQEKWGSEVGKNKDRKIVMIKFIIQKEKKTAGIATTESSVCLVKVLELFLWHPILILALGILGFVEKVLILLSDISE
jgi:hypothetical protein